MENEFLNTIKRYEAIITKICFYYAGNREDFEDLRQDTLTNLWRGWKSFRGDANRSTWIYRVCLNTCVSSVRKTANLKTIPIESNPVAEGIVDNDVDVAALHRELHSLIQNLNAREKAIVLLWLDEVPYDTIAEIMGEKRNNIASILRRAKEKLVKMSNR